MILDAPDNVALSHRGQKNFVRFWNNNFHNECNAGVVCFGKIMNST